MLKETKQIDNYLKNVFEKKEKSFLYSLLYRMYLNYHPPPMPEYTPHYFKRLMLAKRTSAKSKNKC